MLPVMLAAIAALGPAGELRVQGELNASQLARSLDMTDAPDVARAELTLAPRLSLHTDGSLRLELSYAPSLLVPADLAGNTEGLSGPLEERSVLLHRAGAGAALALPVWRLHASGAVTSGDTLLVGEPAAGGGAGQAVATTARIPLFGVELGAGATGEPVRGTTVALTASASRSGGADEEARGRLPTLESVGVSATLDRRVARRHTLGLSLLANRTRVGEEVRGDAGYLRAGASWGHQVARDTALRAAAGAALTYERAEPTDAPELDDVPPVLPWVEGSLDLAPGGTRPSFRVGVAVEPVVDRFDGAIDVRGGASATLGWAPFREWTFGLRGSSSASFGWSGRSTPGGGPHTLVSGAGVSASHRLTEELRLSATAGSTWQTTEREELPEFREDLVTLELSTRLFAF